MGSMESVGPGTAGASAVDATVVPWLDVETWEMDGPPIAAAWYRRPRAWPLCRRHLVRWRPTPVVGVAAARHLVYAGLRDGSVLEWDVCSAAALRVCSCSR